MPASPSNVLLARDEAGPVSDTLSNDRLIARVDVRGGVISDQNRIKLHPQDFREVQWHKPTTVRDESVSPKSKPADAEPVEVSEDFETLEQIHARMEGEYGGRNVYESMTGKDEDDDEEYRGSR